MKSQGIFPSDLVPSHKPALPRSSSEKSLPGEENIIGPKQNADVDSHTSNLSGNLKSDPKGPANTSTTSAPTVATLPNNGNDKDKSFGKMAHYLNELKKEIDNASKAKKENGLETQRLRERCVQLEERLQSEKNKNLLLEERLDKSLKKQKELQLQLDNVLQSYQQHQQQVRSNIQGVDTPAPVVIETQAAPTSAAIIHQPLPSPILQTIPAPNISTSMSISTALSANVPNGTTAAPQPAKAALPSQAQTSNSSSTTKASIPTVPSKTISSPSITAQATILPASNIGMMSAPTTNTSNPHNSTSSSTPGTITPRYPTTPSPSTTIGISTGNDIPISSNPIHSHPAGPNQSNSNSTPPNFSNPPSSTPSTIQKLSSNPSHDEFDTFIASRGDVWTDTPAIPITRPIPDPPRL